MNTKERRKLVEFPDGLDAAVNAKYPGCECETIFSIVSLRHVTTFTGDDSKKKEIRAFIAGFIAGNQELANRLLSNAKE